MLLWPVTPFMRSTGQLPLCTLIATEGDLKAATVCSLEELIDECVMLAERPDRRSSQ